MERDYAHGFAQRPMESYGMEKSNERFGPYESYDSRSSMGGRDLYRSGYGYNDPEQSHFGDSYDGRYENPYRNSVDSYEGRNQGGSSWDSSFTRSKVRTGYMEDRGRDNYSSYGSFSSPYMKPASVGSRGRGMSAYPDNAFGGRSNDAFGGPSSGRGRGRGQMSDFGYMRRPGIVVDYKNQSSVGMARGMKRKMQSFKQPGAFGKKAKIVKPGQNKTAKNSPPPAPVNEEEEEKRRTEARREKQRRRREKNSEKYGDGYRMAFTCSFCKFRSFEEKGIEEHLESTAHQEMLDHIQKQTKFDKPVMEFLHECIVNKYKKTAVRKTQTIQQNEAAKTAEKDVMEGVTPEDHMMKVETVHCSACSVYVPALHSSVQLHLKSTDHSKNKVAYKDQIKRESILTATSILNNPLVKARYELYLKGENPFEAQPDVVEAHQEEETAAEPGPPEPEPEDFTSDALVTPEES